MRDDMFLFQRAAACHTLNPLHAEGFFRALQSIQVSHKSGARPLVTHTFATEKHVRVIRDGRMGFAAASANVDWADLLNAANQVAVFGPARKEGFIVEELAGNGRLSAEPGIERLLVANAQEIVERIQRVAGNAHIQLTAEYTHTYVDIANGETIANKEKSRVECGLMVLTPDGQALAVVKRDVADQYERGWGAVLESALKQIESDDRRVEFNHAVKACLLHGRLYLSLIRRYLAFAFDPERLEPGRGFSIRPAPCLHVIHDPACVGKTFDDEGQVIAAFDIFRDGCMHVPARYYSKRAWLGEPVPDLGGLRVIPGHGGPELIDRGAVICELAELDYNAYEGTCSALVTEGYMIVGSKPAGRLPTNLGVVIDIRGLVERALAVWPGPVEHTQEGTSPPILVDGSIINWC